MDIGVPLLAYPTGAPLSTIPNKTNTLSSEPAEPPPEEITLDRITLLGMIMRR